MQRQICMKLLSKISRNLSNPNANWIPSQSQPIFSTNTNSSSYSHHLYNRSRYSYTSQFSLLRPHTSSYTKILAKRYFSNANTVSKGQSKSTPVNVKINSHSFDSGSHGGLRRPRLTTGKVVVGLLVTNVSVFLLWQVADPQFMINNFMLSVENFTSRRVHTLITSAFSHEEFEHLTNNMIGLVVFGILIGGQLGPQFLLKLYFCGALVGSIFYLLDHAFIAPLQRPQNMSIDPRKIPGLGASGAVNAIMLLHIFLNPGDTLLVELMPVPAILLGIYIIWEDTKRIMERNDRISGSAHLGGATVAAIAWAIVRRF